MRIRYTAKRSLMAGHVVDTAYEFDLKISRRPRSNDFDKTEHRSVSGRTETYFRRQDKFYDFTTIGYEDDSAEAAQLIEFLDSVFDGTQFEVDVYGSIATPGTYVFYVAEGKNYQERIVGGEGSNYVSYSFKAREVQ